MTQGELPFDGRALRDEGIGRVSRNNSVWASLCTIEFNRWAKPAVFTGEDIRFHCESLGLIPRHQNGWGALTNALVRRGVIEFTGDYVQPKDRVSHARCIKVYKMKGQT